MTNNYVHINIYIIENNNNALTGDGNKTEKNVQRNIKVYSRFYVIDVDNYGVTVDNFMDYMVDDEVYVLDGWVVQNCKTINYMAFGIQVYDVNATVGVTVRRVFGHYNDNLSIKGKGPL